MRATIIATTIAAAHGFATTPESACPIDVFGYVNPLTDAVVDVSVGPLVLADGFGFGPAGGSYLYDAEWAHVLHYMPGLYDIPGAADARQAFNGAGYPGLGGMEPGGLPGLCIRPGPPGCGVYTKTTYTPECPFLGEGADLIMGAMSNYNSGLNPDGTFTGCDIVAQETYCFEGFDENGAIPVDCDTCEGRTPFVGRRRKMNGKLA
jgi:hypothetical protein